MTTKKAPNSMTRNNIAGKEIQTESFMANLNDVNGILDLIGQGVRIIDKDYRVQFVNRVFADMSGVDRQRAVGMKCWEVFAGP